MAAAASTTRAMSLVTTTSSGIGPSNLSSRSAFASPIVNVAPCKSTRARPMIVRASADEEPKATSAGRRALLTTLMAAGAMVASSSGNAVAGQGPGIGAQKTAKKANELLKAGDDLINNDSPPRYGASGLASGLEENKNRIAQQAGSGAVSELQGGAEKTIQGAKSNLRKAQARIDGIFGKKKESAVATNPLEKAAGDVSGGVDDLVKNGPGKIKSDVRTTGNKVKKDVASSRGFGRKLGNGLGAQDKTNNAVEQGKGLLGNLKDMVTDATQ